MIVHKKKPIALILAHAIGVGAFVAVPAVALAQDADAQKVERVTITGSSIKRVESEGALPVTTITREEIERSGATSIEQLTAQMPTLSSANATNSAQGTGSSTYGESTLSMRGLGSQRTLVLLNGRRLASYAADNTGGVDINSIPISALERVEVLRDGASSVYGSDAVAGVVNFILRDHYQGFEANAFVGTPTRSGGGQTERGGFLAGWGDYAKDGQNLMFSVDVTKDRALFGRDRNFADKAWDYSPNGIWDASATPSGAIKSWVAGTSYLNQYLADTGATYINSSGATKTMFGLKSFPHPLSPDNCAQNGSAYNWQEGTCRYDPSPYMALLPETDRVNVMTNFKKRLEGGGEAFGELVYNHTKTKVEAQPSPYSAVFLMNDPLFAPGGETILLKNTNFYYANTLAARTTTANGQPVYTGDLSVSLRAFDGGGRVHTDYSDMIHLVAGLKDSWKTWDYDFDAFYNQSKVREETNGGYQLQSKLVAALNSPAFQDGNLANGEFNPFVQYQDATVAAAIRASTYNGDIISSKLTNLGIEGKTTTTLSELAGGSLQIAIGGQINQEKIDYAVSDAILSGDVSGYGGAVKPIKASRNHYAIFGEVVAPFTKALEGTGSLRADQYQGVGSSFNPKLSLRFQPVKEVVLRGSIGTGFRAPSLPELYQPQTTATTPLMVDPFAGIVGQFPQEVGGNTALKPEKSKQASFGAVFEPVKNFSVGADYFRIKIDDPILQLSPAFMANEAANGNPYYQSIVTTGGGLGGIVDIININRNGGRMDVSGVDLDVNWKIARLDAGVLSATLNGTYLNKYDLTDPSGKTQSSVGQTVDAFNSSLNAIQNGGLILKWKHVLTVALTNPDWSVSFTQNYQSGYEDAWKGIDSNNSNGGIPNEMPTNKISSFSTYDINASYTAIKNVKISAGVKNVFDKNPPQISGSGAYFQAGYDPSYYDARARFMYLSLNLKFK